MPLLKTSMFRLLPLAVRLWFCATAIGNRQSTNDINAKVLAPDKEAVVRPIVREMAEAHNMPIEWLNSSVDGYIQGHANAAPIFDDFGITVFGASAEQMLAMKLWAWRGEKDFTDAVTLLKSLEGSTEEILSRISEFLAGPDALKACYRLEEAWELAYGGEN